MQCNVFAGYKSRLKTVGLAAVMLPVVVGCQTAAARAQTRTVGHGFSTRVVHRLETGATRRGVWDMFEDERCSTVTAGLVFPGTGAPHPARLSQLDPVPRKRP